MAKMTLEKLAILMQESFTNLSEAMQKGFNNITDEFTLVKTDISGLKKDTGALKEDIVDLKLDSRILKQGQEDIILRLDQKANKIDVDELAKQINKIYPKY